MLARNSAAQTGTITIFVPGLLREYCAGAARLTTTASRVRAALEEVEARYPVLYRSVCNETGAVRRHVNLFVNTEHIRDLDGLDTALTEGDELIILPAISGG
ncbi:MAG TPA: MoaD/ThiS family protein [Thermoanaerobaculia bacterium]|jgi:molybdopterin converting factor small subunit